MKEPLFLVVDLFCGAGGVTTGFALAENNIAKVIACINHDHNAILSHWANHPEVKHFEEDIRNLDLTELVKLVNFYRKKYPNAKIILWASLECAEYSKAKGGLAREADSRTLAKSLHMKWNDKKKKYYKGDSYIQLLNPDYIMIENVVEFKDGGPTRVKMRDGKAVRIKNKHKEWVDGHELIPETKGEFFTSWRKDVCALGYVDEWRQMNSADYGAYTSRNRLFGMFAKKESDIIWPDVTHAKNGKGGLKKWMAVKEKLDFTDEGYTIFYRGRNQTIPKRQRKDLSNNTLERIYAGCIKHIAGGREAFLTKYHGTKPGGQPRTHSIENPLCAIDTQNRFTVVQPAFIAQRNSGKPDSKIVDIDGPLRTITKTGGNQDLVQASFLSMYHGNGDNTHSVLLPAPTIPAADVSAIVQASFIDRPFTDGGGKNSSIESPVGSIPTVPKLNLIQASAFVDSGQYTNVPTSIEEPARPITANRKYPYLLNLQYGGQIKAVDEPCRTIIAQSGKNPEYLIITETGQAAIQIYETDSPIVVKLKEFMALYNIIDIKMRMLRVDELLRIQGFPDKYNLYGTQEDQKKFIGNSVVPHVVKSWTEAMATGLINLDERKMAI